MPDIFHEFTIKAPRDRVFDMMATPAGLDRWWTQTSAGRPAQGEEYVLFFGPDYDWRAKVTRCVPGSEFELQMTSSHPDWMDTRVGCQLESENQNATRMRFYHTGWPADNEHWRVSCYCWAMYLRLLRRYLEYGEVVPYERRLEV